MCCFIALCSEWSDAKFQVYFLMIFFESTSFLKKHFFKNKDTLLFQLFDSSKVQCYFFIMSMFSILWQCLKLRFPLCRSVDPCDADKLPCKAVKLPSWRSQDYRLKFTTSDPSLGMWPLSFSAVTNPVTTVNDHWPAAILSTVVIY